MNTMEEIKRRIELLEPYLEAERERQRKTEDYQPKQPDSLLHEGKTWVSLDYFNQEFKKGVELAYRKGLGEGCKISFHAIEPTTNNQSDALLEDFKKVINEKFMEDLRSGKIWR